MKITEQRWFWILLVLILLAGLSVWILWAPQSTGVEADLVVLLDADTPVGSIGVSCTRPDGSQSSEQCIRADEQLFRRGEQLFFQDVSWPAVVTLWSDVQGTQLLMQFCVEQLEDAQGGWKAVISDGPAGLTVDLVQVPGA